MIDLYLIIEQVHLKISTPLPTQKQLVAISTYIAKFIIKGRVFTNIFKIFKIQILCYH